MFTFLNSGVFLTGFVCGAPAQRAIKNAYFAIYGVETSVLYEGGSHGTS